jgi:uncharacterized protein YwgA
MTDLTHRQKIMLAALAAEGGGVFAPVQVQKLFFLLDTNVAAELGGRQFSFEPYDYGPYDRCVYTELEALARQGLVAIEAASGAAKRKYSLTAAGYQTGQSVLKGLNPRAQEYLQRVSAWIRSLGFAELVGAIYQQYPDMKVNSVFRD